jgi:hypothetical protein
MDKLDKILRIHDVKRNLKLVGKYYGDTVIVYGSFKDIKTCKSAHSIDEFNKLLQNMN